MDYGLGNGLCIMPSTYIQDKDLLEIKGRELEDLSAKIRLPTSHHDPVSLFN